MQTQLEKIRSGQLAPVYLVQGTDNYLLSLVKQAFLKQALPIEEQELNIIQYNMLQTTIDTVVEEANSVPFFGDMKIVMLEQPYFLTSDKPKQAVEQSFEQLEAYCQAPNPSTCLVIVAPYESLDNRKKIVKTLKKIATVIDVAPLNEKELSAFVQQHIQASGYNIDRQVLQLLLERTQYQLAIVMNELDKLFLAALDTKHIQKQDVNTLVAKSLESNVFQLVECVLKQQKDKALSVYHDLVLQKEEPIKLLALLLSQFRLMLQVMILQSKGYQQADIVAKLKQHPYRVRLAMQQSAQYAYPFILSALKNIIETDYLLKTGQANREIAMELMLLKMMSIQGGHE